MRNILIAGASLVNKGAQAMTLITICELKKRFPEHRMVLLTWDASSAAKAKHAMYDLELLEVPAPKFARAAWNPFMRTVYSLRYGEQFKKPDAIYRNADLFVDVSGYALGSNWSSKVCNDYLNAIEHALAYGIPVYLMPQSFGPFDYTTEEGKTVDARTRRLFPQAKHIFAREQEGFDALIYRYGLTNVSLTYDMVLSSKIEDYSPALLKKTDSVSIKLPANCVGIVPSVKIRHVLGDSAAAIYEAVIAQCLRMGMCVAIIYHSTLDKSICNDLKATFNDDDRVILLEHDHSCMEFNELVRKFRFVVASRFHAIVHALKNGVPCVALGWATKYMDLMKLFSQERFVFDLRKPLDLNSVERAVAEMAQVWQDESERIRSTLPELQKENVFDLIKKA